MKYYFTLIIFGVLNSCSVGPNYVPPEVTLPSQWTKSVMNTSSLVEERAWWQTFNDPLLNELIEHCAVANLDIKAVQARINSARAEYQVAAAQLFPVASITMTPPTGTGVAINQLIALSTTLDPDLFGKIRQNKQRARANLYVQQAEGDAVLINLYAEIASSYLELREIQAKNASLQHNIAGNKDILRFVTTRYQKGYTNYLNIAQQKGLIETQLADFAQNESIIMALAHKIEFLTGNNPGVLAKRLLVAKSIPQSSSKINLGVPAELLRRRPDIVAAEQRIIATHANIRIAMASMFPQVNIGWLLGWQTQTLSSHFLAIQNPDSTLFGTLAAPLFNVSLYRSIDLRKKEKIIAVIQYQMAILRALHEVETQYIYFQNYQKSIQHLQRAVKQKRLVLKLSKDIYQKGFSDFSTLLRAEEDINNLEFAYIHLTVMSEKTKINLYRALGGSAIKS